MKIVQVRPRNWERIRKEIYAVEKQTFEKELRYEEVDFESFLYPKSINLVVVDKGRGKERIVAYLMSSRLEDDKRCRRDSHFGKHDSFYVESIAVIPSYQGKGLGKKMLVRFLKEVEKQGYKRILLDATSVAMERLAEKFGFRKIRNHKNWEGNRSAWLMEKMSWIVIV